MDSLKVVDYKISILEMFRMVCLKIVPALPKIIKALDFCIKECLQLAKELGRGHSELKVYSEREVIKREKSPNDNKACERILGGTQ